MLRIKIFRKRVFTSKTCIKQTQLYISYTGQCLLRHFYSGDRVSPLPAHVYVHKCYCQPLVGCGKRRADVLLLYMGTVVDVKLWLSEMFPGNGGIWLANRLASSATWQTRRHALLFSFWTASGSSAHSSDESVWHCRASVVRVSFAVFILF